MRLSLALGVVQRQSTRHCVRSLLYAANSHARVWNVSVAAPSTAWLPLAQTSRTVTRLVCVEVVYDQHNRLGLRITAHGSTRRANGRSPRRYAARWWAFVCVSASRLVIYGFVRCYCTPRRTSVARIVSSIITQEGEQGTGRGKSIIEDT